MAKQAARKVAAHPVRSRARKGATNSEKPDEDDHAGRASLQSPMRAELCGAILPLASGRPLSLAADNAAVVTCIKRALRALRRARFLPYHYRRNEDVWANLRELIKKHQSEAINATWAKTPATQPHIQQGTTTEWEGRQNEKADAAAEEGRLHHDPRLRAVAGRYKQNLV